MVRIQAFRTDGSAIEWEYDTPQQCAHFWRTLQKYGLAPDTGCKLIRAYYFGPKHQPGSAPDKVWMS